jgi:hypothetical protein
VSDQGRTLRLSLAHQSTWREPRGKEYRRFKLSTQITAKLRAHVVEHDLERDNLLFEMPLEERPRVRVPYHETVWNLLFRGSAGRNTTERAADRHK